MPLLTLKGKYQGFTLIPLLTPTVHTMYCNVVLVACHKSSELMLCDTGSSNVQKSSMWGLRSIGGNVDEIEISTVSTTQCPAHIDSHSSTEFLKEGNTGEGRGGRGT